MKKKEIEKIPYMTLPKISNKKDVKYIGVTACMTIQNEKHIILEVYENDRKCRKMPLVRYVATTKDYGIFTPKDGTWSRKKIYTDRLAWTKEYTGYIFTEDKNILYTEKDLDRIRSFFKGIKVWNEKYWWEFFLENENKIKKEKQNKRYQARMERLKQRIKETPQLNEAVLLDWAKERIFGEKHYLYYKKKGRYATICCSKCGGVYDGAWKGGDSYESQFQRKVNEPVAGLSGTCELCGAFGEYKCQGKAKGMYTKIAYVYTADKYHDTGAVIRYIQVEQTWQLEEIIGDLGEPQMHGACESFRGVEIARKYMEKGRKSQVDFQKYNPYAGKNFWDDCNFDGMANITIQKGRVCPMLYQNLKGTYLQYSAIERFCGEYSEIHAFDYLERYTQFPQLEMMVKMGLYGVAADMARGFCGVIQNTYATRPEDFLGIRKEHLKDLIKEKGSTVYLEYLRIEKNMGMRWTDEQIKKLVLIKSASNKTETALRFMTLEKLINRIEKYAGEKIEAAEYCSRAHGQINSTATMYFDYLDMRQQLGYDLNNSVYAYPRNLENAHQKMILEQDEKKLDVRMEEVRNKYPEIKRMYRKLRNQYFYENRELQIRPARTAEEIVREGRILHHCVGGDGYLTKHNNGESYILMLRATDKPDIPYITVEMDPKTYYIRQWYGAYDKKPDKVNIDRWLGTYTARLKCIKDGTLQPGAETAENETFQEMLIVAG